MASGRFIAAVLSGLSLAACGLPTPDYKVNQYPAPYRKEADGTILDNEAVGLDVEGYRVTKEGKRIDVVDVPAKTAGESSNAVAGYYISSQGANAPGSVMSPSVGADSGAGYGPGSTTVTGNIMSTPTMSGAPANVPPPTGQPVQLNTPPSR